jgi:hypothetical protein
MTTQNSTTTHVGSMTTTTTTTPHSTIDVRAIVRQVLENVSALENLPKECREISEIQELLDDADFMIHQCCNNETNIRFASARLLDDVEFILEAVEIIGVGEPIEWGSFRMQKIIWNEIHRKHIIPALLASKHPHHAIHEYVQNEGKYLSAENIATCAKKDVSILDCLAFSCRELPQIQELLDDADFMLEQVKHDPKNLDFASARLLDDVDFIKSCVNAGTHGYNRIVRRATPRVKQIMAAQNTGK